MKAMGVVGPHFVPGLFDVDEPTAGSDRVVVEVLASSVNEFDRAAARGRYNGQATRPGPVLLGRDFVGRVAAVGENVNYIDVGMYVAGALAPHPSGHTGTFTDKVAVPAQLLAPVPDGIDFVHVAGVGLAGVTALDAVGALGLTGLETVAIQGPMSGVGGYALQLAKARGAVVVALTSAAHAELAWTLGADAVILEGANPTRSVQRMRNVFSGGVDSAIHVAGDIATTAAVVRPGGQFTSVADAAMPVTHSSRSEYVPTMIAPNGHKLADLLFKVAALRLRSHVSGAISFDQVGDAVSPDRSNAGRIVVVR
jgi:NADPH:quinone reductase-like Zn-dependent oxidoreductase